MEIQTIVKQPLNLLFISYFLVLISFVYMIKSSYDMKGSYEYGIGLQNQCTPVFMERERAEFQAYNVYNESVRKQFETAYLNLLSVSIIIIICSYILWLFFVFILNFTDRDSKSYLFMYTFEKTVQGPGGKLPLLHTVFMKYGIPAGLLGTMIYLLSVWINGNYIGAGDIKLSPFGVTTYKVNAGKFGTYDEEEKKKIIKNQYLYLSLIFGIILLGTMIYNPVIPNSSMTPIPSSFIVHIILLYIIMMVIIPTVADIIVDFQNKIGVAYENKSRDLNNSIVSVLNGSNEVNKINLTVELEKNIIRSETNRLGATGSGAPDLSNINNSDYKESVYEYAMHVINDSDIQGIPIPQQLKQLIKPIYLSGEQIIDLKRTLVKIYNLHIDGSEISASNLRSNGKDKELLTYLIPDVAIKMATTAEADNAIRTKYLTLLNTYIVNNPSFKKGNPLPSTIVDNMSIMRGDSAMKEVIDGYFTKVNGLVMFIIFAYAYYIYHTMYKNYPEGTIQKVSLVAFILLVILGFTGWFTKELWI